MENAHLKLLNDSLIVSRETSARLQAFRTLFGQWSKRINLVASSTTNELWKRHVEDSAQLLLIKPNIRTVVDLGSGGGFPGIILAILLEENSDSEIHLIESNRKKTAFLQAVRVQCARRSLIHADRIEVVLPKLEAPQFITARALASLDKLLALTSCHLSNGTVGLFHKGRDYQKEIEESRAHWDFDLLIHKSKIDDESVILEVSNLRKHT